MMRPLCTWSPAGRVLALALALACGPALAHKGSDAYLDVQQTPAPAGAGSLSDFRFSLAVALRDLDLVVPIDANADARVSWGEVRSATPQVLAALNTLANLQAPGGAAPAAATGTLPACRLDWQADGLERRSDGVYFRAVTRARCPAGEALSLDYRLLKNEDSTHRLLVAGRLDGKDFLSTVSPQQGRLPLSAGTDRQAVAGAPAASSGRLSALRDYFSLGMHHLLEGYDHLAFLLALVLPLHLSLRRRSRPAFTRRMAIGADVVATHDMPSHAEYASRATWITLLRTVTAFTVGHSITLMLATFGLTQASPLWVEPVIALSIAVTALLNLRPVKWIRFDVLALLFGLVHGFGFAGLLQEAAAPQGLLPWALAGFNLGVEAGQLLAVLGWVLLSQMLVGKAWYDRVVVRGGSAALLLLALWWFWQRVA